MKYVSLLLGRVGYRKQQNKSRFQIKTSECTYVLLNHHYINSISSVVVMQC